MNMSKTMEMFFKLRDTGIAITLENLDQMYQKEMNDRLKEKYSRVKSDLKTEMSHKNDSQYFSNMSEEQALAYKAGLYRALQLLESF